MILHGKDLIVSIDGNAAFASKSCSLEVNAKSIVKTSPTSGEWEEILSGKKSWSLTTNQLVKKATEEPTHEGTLTTAKFLFENSKEGWAARGKFSALGRSAAFDDFGADSGVTVLEVTKEASIIKKHTFTDETPLIHYLKGESSIDGTAITSDGIVALLFIGSFQLGSNTCDVLTNTFHVSLPFISYSGQSPIIIVGGKTLDYGYVSLDDMNNEVIINLTYGDQNIIPDGISGGVEMIGKIVTINMTDSNGCRLAGQAIVKKFKVTGTRGTLMAGSFAFTGNGELQTNAKQSTPTAPEKTVDRIIIDMSKSNPVEMITGDINGSVFQSIMSGLGRYLGKYQGDGAMSIIRLNDNNSLKYYGTEETATLDGTQGDIFVCIRNTTTGRYGPIYIGFYYSILYLDENRIMFSVSKSSLQGYKYWSCNNLIGAFKAQATTSYNNNVAGEAGGNYYLRSIVADRNSLEDTVSNLNTAKARMNNNYFGFVGKEEHAIISLLYLMKYGNTNSQAMCGSGANVAMPTGFTVNMGMQDSDSFNGSAITNLLGIENWWGGGIELMEGISYANGNITYGDGQTIAVSGSGNPVIQNMLIQANPLLMLPQGAQPSNTDYSSHFCDAVDFEDQEGQYAGTNIYRGKGGSADGGISWLKLGANMTSGTRLCFHADTITEEYQDDYEALTAVDPAN